MAAAPFAGRRLTAGLSVLLGGQLGVLGADTTGGTVTPKLLEAYARTEYSVRPEATVSPVLLLGGGRYQLKGGSDGRDVFHANWFWSAGAGVDVVMSPTLTAQFRVERQSMSDTNQGRVATLWPVGVGVRLGL